MNAGILIALGAALFLLPKNAHAGTVKPAATSTRIPFGGGRTIDAAGVIRDSAGNVVGHGTPTQYAQQLATYRTAQGQSPDQTLNEIRMVAGLAPALVKSLEALVASGTESASKIVNAFSTGDTTAVAELRDEGLTTDMPDWTSTAIDTTIPAIEPDFPVINDVALQDFAFDAPIDYAALLPPEPIIDFGVAPYINIIPEAV